MRKKFIYALMDGDVTLDQVDADVELWHMSCSKESLAAFLGLTDDEYTRFVRDSKELLKIAEERKADDSQVRKQDKGS